MRFGLIGRGPQAQRYLEERNGGQSIVSQLPGRVTPDHLDEWLPSVDAVIIATHPAIHSALALVAIAAGKPVLIEKPLALTLADCERVIYAAELAAVPLEVAHTHLWHERFPIVADAQHSSCNLSYSAHERDYSAWLDWGPHVLSMLEAIGARHESWTFNKGWRRELRLTAASGSGAKHVYTGREPYTATPMWRMLDAFARGATHGYDFQRRVYRALFAFEEKQNGRQESNRD